MAERLERRDHCLKSRTLFDKNRIARGKQHRHGQRLGNRQAPVDIGDDAARHLRRDRCAAGRADGEHQLAVAPIDQRRGHRTARSLAALDPVGDRLAVLVHEGEREAAFRAAEAREREAEAEAKATDMVSTAISKGDIQAINYFLGLKYTEALQAIASAPNQKVILMPLEASNVIGALGGIAELARSALSDQATAAPRRASVPGNQS